MPEPLEQYPIIDVSDWEFVREEAIGGEEKYWLEQPAIGHRWLFKPDNFVDNCLVPWYQREGVTEKITCELATRLGVPCAQIELAVRDGRPGCISLDLAPRHWQLQTGAVVLGSLLSDYVPGNEQGNNSARVGHSLVNIQHALREHEPQPGFKLPEDFDAFDIFVGYVMFDALVANRDRHDENWAVLLPPTP